MSRSLSMHSRTSLYEPSCQRPSISSRPLFHIADAGISVTDHRGRKRNHAARNAAMGQEIAGENEKRDRHDLETFDAREQLQPAGNSIAGGKMRSKLAHDLRITTTKLTAANRRRTFNPGASDRGPGDGCLPAVFGGMPYRAAQSTCVMSCDTTSRRAEGPTGRSSYSAEKTPGSVNASCLAYGPGVLEVVMRPPIIAWNTVAMERRMVISGARAASGHFGRSWHLSDLSP